MEIRKITPDEYLQAKMISTVSFSSKMPANYREEFQRPNSEDYMIGDIWAAFQDDGRMVSMLHIHDMEMQFDGHAVGMGGIGGVSTLPEDRVGGHMRRMNEAILPWMKEQGMVFSFLYPWSFSFYRKFGYELCYTPSVVRIPMDYFREYDYDGNVTMYEPGNDISPFYDVYNEFIKDKNHAVARTFDRMKWRFNKDPYTSRNYAYLHKNKNGEPDAYIVFTPGKKGDNGDDMHVRELCWGTPEGLQGIFGFASVLSQQFADFHWEAPYLFNPYQMFKESYTLSLTRPAKGMNRLLNVQKAFELMKTPETAGKAAISIEDKFMPGNTGIYSLEWENSVMTSVKKGACKADVETNVETLVQLITGYLTIDDAKLKRDVNLIGNEANLRALFPYKDMIIMDSF